MPVFSVLAVKVTPQLNQLQPQPPLEEVIVGPEILVAPDADRAKLMLGRKIPEGTDLALVKMAIIPIPLA